MSFFAIFSAHVVATPTFASVVVTNNNSQYALAKNFGFQINISDDALNSGPFNTI